MREELGMPKSKKGSGAMSSYSTQHEDMQTQITDEIVEEVEETGEKGNIIYKPRDILKFTI